MFLALCVITTSEDQGVSYYNFYVDLNWRIGVRLGQNIAKHTDYIKQFFI